MEGGSASPRSQRGTWLTSGGGGGIHDPTIGHEGRVQWKCIMDVWGGGGEAEQSGQMVGRRRNMVMGDVVGGNSAVLFGLGEATISNPQTSLC